MGFLDMTREDKVAAFRRAADKKNYDEAPNEIDMILKCIHEEMEEFAEAAAEYAMARALQVNAPDLREQLCKEWADLQYVVSQASEYFSIPADASFNRVHESNMTKVVDGKCIFREDGKILKPDTYRAPDMSGL